MRFLIAAHLLIQRHSHTLIRARLNFGARDPDDRRGAVFGRPAAVAFSAAAAALMFNFKARDNLDAMRLATTGRLDTTTVLAETVMWCASKD